MPAGGARIRVTFTVDTDGLLTVSALETSSGVEAAVHVKPSYGLKDDVITSMLQDGFATAHSDMLERALRIAIVDGNRLVAATQKALESDAHLLSVTDLNAIQAAIKALETSITVKQSATDIEQAVQRLNHTTEAFAAMRMTESIKQVLTGKAISEW